VTIGEIVNRHRKPILVGGLLLVFIVQAVASMSQKSVTVDESVYIAAGYYHLKTGDFRFNMTNPPLMKLAAALPLLAMDVDLPGPIALSEKRSWKDEWHYAGDFLYENRTSAESILMAARLPSLALAVLLGAYIFQWSRLLYGENAALFSMVLFCFSPSILAHSRLATQDIGLAALMFLFCFHFWKFMRHSQVSGLVICGGLFGLALLTKHLGLFLIPISGLYALYVVFFRKDTAALDRLPLVKHLQPKGPTWVRHLIALTASYLVIGLVGLFVLNLGYGFQGSLSPLSEYVDPARLQERLSAQNPILSGAADLALEAPIPAPSPYVEGIKFQSKNIGRDRSMYFNGEIHDQASWYFLPIAFLIKTPLPLLLLTAMALASMCAQRRMHDAECFWLIFLSILLLLFIFLSEVNVAVRYLLPIYPLLFVLAGRAWLASEAMGKSAKVGALALALWFVVGSASVYPNYLAYFNEIIGGPASGHKYLVGTNLDLGQDLPGLARYMRDTNTESIKLGYYGSADASHYGIEYEYLPSVGLAPKNQSERWWYDMNAEERASIRLEPVKGTYAISANLLVGRFYPNAYKYFRNRAPNRKIGHTIFLYNIDK